jgi:hypothetical protein
MHVTKIKSPTWLKRNIHIKGVEIILPRGSKKNLDIKGIYTQDQDDRNSQVYHLIVPLN